MLIVLNVTETADAEYLWRQYAIHQTCQWKTSVVVLGLGLTKGIYPYPPMAPNAPWTILEGLLKV